MRYWRHRHKIWDAVQELGCGMLTVMLVSLPVWVLMLAWRGPTYAFGALAVLFLIVLGMGVLNRWMGGTRDK